MTSLPQIDLREKLDEIDSGMMSAVVDGFYNSRLKILIGMWEKGKAIGVFTGVETPNWRELERLTGREHKALKNWYETFRQYQEKKKYIEKVAKPKALAWAQKALPLAEDIKEKPEPPTPFEIAINAYNKLSEEDKELFKNSIL